MIVGTSFNLKNNIIIKNELLYINKFIDLFIAGTNGSLRVITEKGIKNCHRYAPDTREQVTVLGYASADGRLMKPYVIFPGVQPRYNFGDVNKENYIVGRSPNGWINSDCFFSWLSNHFYPEVKAKTPVILFLDGHTSHINLAVYDFCKDYGIIIYCFPPHASHVIQPLDVSVYGPLKKFWNQSIRDFSCNAMGTAMNRAHFFKVFDQAWTKAKEAPGNVISGFRCTGLVPFNPDGIKYSKLMNPKKAQEVFENKTRRDLTSNQEKLGLARALNIIETELAGKLSF